MARRRQRSSLEDLIAALSWLPWWVCVLLAPLGYAVLHPFATPTGEAVQAAAAAAGKTGQIQALVLNSVFTGLATAGQYLVPLVCLLAAAVSFWRRRHRQRLVAGVTQSPGAEALNDMSWREFEHLVGEAFRRQGFRVQDTGGPGADGGVDLVLRKGTETFLVQCKQWKALKVGVDVVRQLYGVMAARGAAGGFVVTSGTYTADAITFAQGRNLTLVDGTRLHALLRQARHTHPCAGQVFSDTAIGWLSADCCSKALGGRLPNLECSRTLL
jgi:restriction system protein